jgi:hypothetical protein
VPIITFVRRRMLVLAALKSASCIPKAFAAVSVAGKTKTFGDFVVLFELVDRLGLLLVEAFVSANRTSSINQLEGTNFPEEHP